MYKYLLTFLSVSMLTACSNIPQSSTNVYISAEAIQCQSNGKTSAETASILTQQGIAVSDTKCGHLANVAVLAMCGGMATNINLHTIASADLAKAQVLGFEDVKLLKQADHLGYDIVECAE